MNVLDFRKMKQAGRRISSTTCYDYWSARLLAESEVDFLLVGDSVAMVMHGHPSTLSATTELMALHVAAVARGAPDKFLVADMPFLAHRKGLVPALESVEVLMRAGAQAVKLEGVEGHREVVAHIVSSGVPVMGHLGLTPQSVHQLGGYRVQGRGEDRAERLLRQALELQEAGCFAIVLECVPTAVAERLTASLEIPTIGIGAGPAVDGQILVLQDLSGLQREIRPRFVRVFRDASEAVAAAVDGFHRAVREGSFPGTDESFE